MIIGHLPAGYLVAKLCQSFGVKLAIVPFVIGAVIPDIDMLYFFLIDNQSTHHHHYITHRPLVWIGAFLIALALRRTKFGKLLLPFSLGAVLHVMLDTTLGSILWLWPFSDYARALVVVPATHSHWLYSFMAHWTFWVEILLVLLALVVFFSGFRNQKT